MDCVLTSAEGRASGEGNCSGALCSFGMNDSREEASVRDAAFSREDKRADAGDSDKSGSDGTTSEDSNCAAGLRSNEAGESASGAERSVSRQC
jgi:hypothetical protein